MVYRAVEMIREERAPSARQHGFWIVGKRSAEPVNHAAHAVDEPPRDAALQGRLGGVAHRILGQIEGHSWKLGGAGPKRPPDQTGAGADRAAPIDAVAVHDLAGDRRACIDHDHASRGATLLDQSVPIRLRPPPADPPPGCWGSRSPVRMGERTWD